MARMGEHRVAVTDRVQLIFSWAAVQSKANNASTVSWNLLLEAGSYGRIHDGEPVSWGVLVGEESAGGTADVSIEPNSRKTLGSGTAVIAHDGMGEASFGYGFYLMYPPGQEDYGIVSGEAVLDPIDLPVRPVTVESAQLGSLVVIGLEGNQGAVCDVFWELAGETGIIAREVSGSVDWSIPMTLGEKFPNATEAEAVIRCESPRGSARCGIRLLVPDTLVPGVTVLWEDVSGAYEALGALAQNVSSLVVETAAQGVLGSVIREQRVLLEGKPWQGGVVTEAGEQVLSASVTDSRGRSGSFTQVLRVLPYRVPWLSVTASRCREDGVPDDTGEFARVQLVGTVSPLEGKNTAVLKLYYPGGEKEFPVTAEAVAGECILPVSSASTMELRGVLSDRLTAVERSMILSTGYATADLLAGGRGIAFGTTATREGFECAMPAFFTGGVEGAAPDGFGIGSDGTGRITALSDYNAAVKTGFYLGAGEGTRNAPSPDMTGGLLLTQRGQAQMHQRLLGRGFTAERWGDPGTGWESWCWVNPPMESGLEYRLDRFFLGKPVYTMAVEFGYLPDTGTRTVPLGELGFLCGIRGVIQGEGRCYPVNTDGLGARFYTENGSLCCVTTGDLSGYRGYVVLEYTKEA